MTLYAHTTDGTIDQIGALCDKRMPMYDRRGWVEKTPTVAERIGGHVDDAHDDRHVSGPPRAS